MKNNQIFSVNRFKLLVARQLTVNYKTMLIAAGAITGFLIVVSLLTVFTGGGGMSSEAFLGLVMPFFFIGGYLLTSVSFSELNTPHKGYLYLMLPATAFEKLMSAWVISSVMYLVSGALIIWGINLLLLALSSIVGVQGVEVINMFSPEVLKPLGVYLVTQSIFFLGAIWFRKVHFLKTLLSMFGVLMMLMFFTGIMMMIFFFRQETGFTINSNNSVNFSGYPFVNELMKYLFWICLAPFFITVAYFRLKEREV
jgi:hypothetical protein